MKVYLLSLVICLFLFKSSSSQEVVTENLRDSPIESFQKYSYLLIQYPKINSIDARLKVHHGTGFFLKVKKKLFLVSNYHVVTGADGMTLTFKNSYDSIKIRYYDVNGKPDYFKIDLQKVNATRKVLSFKHYPDLFLIQVLKLPKNAKIYALDERLFDESMIADCKKAFSYQYALVPGNSIQLQINKLEEEYNFLPAYTSGYFYDERLSEPTGMARNYSLESPQSILKDLIVKNWSRAGSSDLNLPDSSDSSIPRFGDIFEIDDSLHNSAYRSSLTFTSPFDNLNSHFLIQEILTFRLANYLFAGGKIFRPSYKVISTSGRKKTTIYVDDNFYLGDMIDYGIYSPSLYLGDVVNNLQCLDRSSNLYTCLSPATYQGASGSPIFYACEKSSSNGTEKWCEFGGVQSSIDVRLDISVIVLPSQIISIIRSGKNIDRSKIVKN